MKLVGKKLYRTGPLKLFNQSPHSRESAQQATSLPSYSPGSGQRSSGGGRGPSGPSPEEIERRRKAAEKARKLAEAKKLLGDTRMQDWEATAKKDLFDPEQQALYERRKQLAEDVGSGAAARRGAEAGLRAQMAAAGAGRGSAAQRMRGLARAQEAGVRSAAAQGAASAAQQFGMLGQAGQGRFGMMRSDKAGRLGYFQKRRGLEVAEEAAKAQAAATRSANSGGKASGGEIFKKYAKGGEFKRKNGKIEGPGTETSDDIKAMLSDGEFVVNAKTVRGIGEAMGAEGKDQSRAVGSGFLYDLQRKYGDKEPVKKMDGGMMLGVLGAHAAKKGLLGKKLKGVGEIASAALDVKQGMDKKKGDLEQKEADVQQKAHKRESLHQMATGGDVKEYGGGGPVKDKEPEVKKGKFVPSKKYGKLDEDKKRKLLRERQKMMQMAKKMGINVELKKYKKGGKVEITPEAKQIPKELEKASKMHKSQAERLKKMGFKHGGHVKPDFLDVDKDGDKKESMKKALKEKKMKYGGEVEYAKGGEVKFGKGVKAKKKFREAIGYKANKVFDKKAEKDYKEGDTGYKNYKGEKSVTPVKMSLGGFLGKIARVGLKAGAGFLTGGPAGAVVGAGKGIMDEAQGDKQKAQAKKQAIAEAEIAGAEKKKKAAEGLQEDVQLKDGGEVSKDHPHYKYLKDLDKFMARQFPKGKKVETDPAIKADKAMRAKKGSIEPMKLQRGKFIDLSGDKIHEKAMKEGLEKYVIRKLQEKERKARRERGKQRFVRGVEKREKALIKDTGDGSRAEEIGKGQVLKTLRKRHELDSRKRGKQRFVKKEAKMADAKLGDAKGLEGNKKLMGAMAKHYQKLEEKQTAKQAAKEHDKRQADKRKAYLKAQQEAAADKLVSKGRRETKSILAEPKEVKKDKGFFGDMSDKDKAGIILGAGKGLLSARQQYLKEKQRRKEALAKGLRAAAATRAAAGQSLISAPVSLRKGGRVSFKDVLKAKKKMGY